MQVTKPKKQRRMLFQAPNHIRHKHFAAHLSPELRNSHEMRTIPIRRGDSVRIMRGDHKGFEGKITRVDRKKYRVYVEGLRREKVDGTTIFVPIHPSKVMITNLNLEDKWRKQILERKKETYKTKEKTSAKSHLEEVDETKKPEEKKTIERKQKRRKKTAERESKKPKRPRKKRSTETKKEETRKTKKTKARRKTTKKTKGGK